MAISLVVSIFALVISGLTAWLTLLRRGSVQMTRPTIIYFGPDGGRRSDDPPISKIFLRTLLYATSKRGRIVESMYVRLRRGETSQNFNIWAYGDNQLNRGSGLFVPESGVATNHHFLLPPDGTSFQFLSGQYTIDVFASLVGECSSRLLHSVDLEVRDEHAASMKQPDMGLFFDWGPDAGRYHGHVRAQPKPELPQFLRDLAG